MGTIVSIIRTVPYGTSKYLVEIIQPTLNKNINHLINSYTYVKEAKIWKIYQDEVQVSYDVVNLYPSVPVDKAAKVLIDTLNNDKEHIQESTKLTLTDINKLTELCLSKCYFLHENNLRLFQNSRPIGLSRIVVLSECYLHKIEFKAITEALNYKIAPKTFRRFVNDSHARFQDRSHAKKFLEILKKQDPAIKYTAEFEDHENSLNSLDINITNNTTNRKYEFKVHRKDKITNIHNKPNSCIDPSRIKSVFKGFLHRAHTIYPEKYIKEEIQVLVNMFVENGHKKTFLEALVKVYNTKNKNSDSRNDTNRKNIPWIHNIGPKI